MDIDQLGPLPMPTLAFTYNRAGDSDEFEAYTADQMRAYAAAAVAAAAERERAEDAARGMYAALQEIADSDAAPPWCRELARSAIVGG